MRGPCPAPATITRRLTEGSARHRATVAWNRVCAPTRGKNCFGRFGREAGQSRVPAPPHIMTGKISKMLVPLPTDFARSPSPGRCARHSHSTAPLQVCERGAKWRAERQASRRQPKFGGPTCCRFDPPGGQSVLKRRRRRGPPQRKTAKHLSMPIIFVILCRRGEEAARRRASADLTSTMGQVWRANSVEQSGFQSRVGMCSTCWCSW